MTLVSFRYTPNETFRVEDPEDLSGRLYILNYAIVCPECSETWLRIIREGGPFLYNVYTSRCAACGGGYITHTNHEFQRLYQYAPAALLVREFLALHQKFIAPKLKETAA